MEWLALAMTTEIGFCPYPKCRRRLYSLEIDGKELTVRPLQGGELHWSAFSIMNEEWDTFAVFCRRHGHVEDFEIDVLKNNFRCSIVHVVTNN